MIREGFEDSNYFIFQDNLELEVLFKDINLKSGSFRQQHAGGGRDPLEDEEFSNF